MRIIDAGPDLEYIPHLIPSASAVGAPAGLLVSGLADPFFSVVSGKLHVDSASGILTTTARAPRAGYIEARVGVRSAHGGRCTEISINVPIADPSTTVAVGGVKTSKDLKKALSPFALPSLARLRPIEGFVQLQLDAAKTFQAFMGVGAAITASSAYQLMKSCTPAVRNAILEEYFGAPGVCTVRISIGDCDYNPDYPSGHFITCDDVDSISDYAELPNFRLRDVDTCYVVPVLLEIQRIKPGLKIIASPWSPPSAIKTESSLTGGKYNGTPGCAQFLANYLARFCAAMAEKGCPIDAITLQNEPDVTGTSYPNCWMGATDAIDVIARLGPALKALSPRTKIWAGDTTSWSSSGRVGAVLSDTNAGPLTEGAAFHAYDGSPTQAAAEMSAHPGKSVNMTEFTINSPAALLQCSGALQGAFYAAGANTATLWNFMLGPKGDPGPNDNLQPLVHVSEDGTGALTRTAQYYACQHIGKYVSLGARRIFTTSNGFGCGWSGNPTDLVSLGFQNPDGSIIVMLVNGASILKTVQIGLTQSFGLSTLATLESGDVVTIIFDKPEAGGEQVSAGCDGRSAA